MSLVIKDGNVFLDKFIKTDVLIKGSKISKIGKDLDGDRVIDASGKHVIPGLVDIHVHFRDFGQEYKEDWIFGSKAASSSGITTVFDMPNNKIPITSKKLRDIKSRKVKEKSLVNFGLYVSVNNSNIKEINESKIKFVKMYYGQTTGDNIVTDAEEVFEKLRKDILIVVHAEDNDIINMNKDIKDKNKVDYHSLVRDNKAEYIAVNDLLRYAKKYGKKMHLTHISCKESLSLIKKAKEDNVKVTCDTCPHFLFLDDSAYMKFGNKVKANPGIKSKKDRDALMKALKNGLIDCICSDHAPHTLEEKNYDYDRCPSGIPGIETTFPLMLKAIEDNKINFADLIRLMVENPVKIFRTKNKGKIKIGNDADLVILDLDKEYVIKDEELFTKAGWSPFNEYKIKGKVDKTIVLGNIVYAENKFGKYLGEEVIIR